MNLKDKPCYPMAVLRGYKGEYYYENEGGLTFRERLIIALASNPALVTIKFADYPEALITTADAIIKQLEEEKK